MENLLSYIPGLLIALDYVIRIAIAFRVIMRRLSVGSSLAWLTVVMAFPFVGVIIYLLIGELRLGNRRAAWAAKIHEPFERWLARVKNRLHVDWNHYSPSFRSISLLAESGVGIPAVPGNRLELMNQSDEVFDRLIQDIDRAQRTCHLEFYIWHPQGRSDEIVEALIRARDRNVICRVLVDAVGSRPFLYSKQARRLTDHGVLVRAALPAGLFRMLFVRFDLRLHRKIVVIDGEIAYTGSMNLVDPRFFKQSAGVGEWVDAMARITGPSVEGLAITFLEDWALETTDSIEKLTHTGDVHALEPDGPSVVHVVPSGPAIRRAAIDRVLITAIYEARRDLTVTTPYFVPDEPLLMAMVSAARRGVKVRLILPELVDSKLVRYASEAYQDDLLQAGVEIYRFSGGLLHTKSVAIDDNVSLFGSLNLDPRSLHLNFEITLAIHCPQFGAQLRQLHRQYIEKSDLMGPDDLQGRTLPKRIIVSVARLLGPLL